VSVGQDTLRYRCASGKSHELVYHVPAIILYPYLLTPAILVGSESLEILILGKKNYPITTDNVNWQLKITKGLDEKKSFHDKPLFAGDAETHIKIDPGEKGHSGDFKQTTLNGDIIFARERFAGLLDKRALDLLKHVEYDQIYRVSIDNITDVENIPGLSQWSEGLYNLFWLYASLRPGGLSSLYTLNKLSDGKLIPQELQDTLIQNVLQELNGKQIAAGGKYCFKVGKDDIDITNVDVNNPIQSYHPVAYFSKGAEYLNIGQLADLHICARQNVLCKSPARVIEYPFEASAPAESGPAASPTAQSSSSEPTSQQEQSPPPVYDIYTIVKGDYLSKIAKRYGMTWKQLWDYDGGTGRPNKIRLKSGDPDLIYPGEEIVVPHQGGGGSQETKPCIALSPTALAFVATEEGDNPEPQRVQVTNSGGGSLEWTVARPQSPWLSAAPLTGTAPSTIEFVVNTTGLARGSYSETVSVSAAEATNTPQTIQVTLSIAPPSKATEVSPEIGSMIGVSSRNIKELLDAIGKDKDIHVLVLSGDLVDYIKSYFPVSGKVASTVKQVWDEVGLDDSFEKRYQDYVDYISIYSLVVYFCRRYGKPIFVVSGNHDCYANPYGISPRLSAPLSWFNKRPNEGIPADHNLTFYEAILAFGETYDELKFSLTAGNFEKEKLKWFYTVLTPFADFAVPSPKQVFVGLAWGDEEDLIDPWQGQGVGHLPRSDDAVTDEQLSLLRSCTTGRALILTSHFTFVSWVETIPMQIAREGEIDIKDRAVGKYSDYNMGTFEINRKALFSEQLGNFKIPLVLNGHSHRRGLYAITEWGQNSVKTTFSDFGGDNVGAVPLIMVPDSAGPLPRLNQKNELRQFGSDRAAGAKVLFNSQGSVQTVNTVQTRTQPRFIVSLDYYDILIDRVITKFECDKFLINMEKRGLVTYAFDIRMLNNIVELIYLESVAMYSYGPDGEWRMVPLRYNGAGRWVIDNVGDAKIFRKIIARNKDRSNYLSMKFKKKSGLVAHYDFDYRWNFEFQVDDDTSGGWPWKRTHKKYIIERDEDYAEIPDFEWRKKFDKYR